MTVSEYLREQVAKHVDTVFSVVGGGSMYLNEAFRDMAVYLHHEQSCAMAAEAYARTRGLGCCVVTTGPGGTNAITGVLGAWQDSIPMLIISGQVRTAMMMGACERERGDQEVDIIDMVRGITKYAMTVTDPRRVPGELRFALKTAQEGRPGPVWLDIPLDVQNALVVPEAQDVAVLVRKAKRPLLLIGSGVPRDSIALLERVGLPVVTAWNATDRLYDGHPLLVGNVSTIGQPHANEVFDSADLIISVGCRLNPRQIGYDWKAQGKTLVVVDIDEAELHKPTLPPHVSIEADATLFLDCLVDALGGFTPLLWPKPKRRELPEGLARAMADIPTSEGEIIVRANGAASVIGTLAMPVKKGQVIIQNSGTAAMGYALPAAIGAAHANPDRRVICIEGDGSLMMNVAELANMPSNLHLYVIDNGGYASIRQSQAAWGLHQAGNDPTIPNLVDIADTFGVKMKVIHAAIDETFPPKWEFGGAK